MSTAVDRLRTQGLRVTRQRQTLLGILDAAQHRHEHLTAAELAERARAELGALSLQAVYDVLQVLVDNGLARRIEPAGHVALYEGRVGDNHHHLVCRQCGHVADVDCAIGSAPCLTPSQAAGFDVDEAEVVFWGRCGACQSDVAEAPSAPQLHHFTTPREREDH